MRGTEEGVAGRPASGHVQEARSEADRGRDVAVRKLNVVGFQTPLARELGRRLTALPYVVVFAPDGKRTEIVGADLGKLASALGGD